MRIEAVQAPWASVDVVADQNGRYRASGFYPGRVGIWFLQNQAEYVLPRGAETVLRDTDTTYDVHGVSVDTLTSRGMPPSMPVSGTILSGRVFERTPEIVRLLAGAAVTTDMTGGWGYDPNNPFTVTDPDGRICCAISRTTWVLASR
jgi:hypothetical protein